MGELEARLAEVEKERDCLQRQMAASLPQVSLEFKNRASHSFSHHLPTGACLTYKRTCPGQRTAIRKR